MYVLWYSLSKWIIGKTLPPSHSHFMHLGRFVYNRKPHIMHFSGIEWVVPSTRFTHNKLSRQALWKLKIFLLIIIYVKCIWRKFEYLFAMIKLLICVPPTIYYILVSQLFVMGLTRQSGEMWYWQCVYKLINEDSVKKYCLMLKNFWGPLKVYD